MGGGVRRKIEKLPLGGQIASADSEEIFGAEEILRTSLRPQVSNGLRILGGMLQERPVNFHQIGHHRFFLEQRAVGGVVELMADEKFLRKGTGVSAGENYA